MARLRRGSPNAFRVGQVMWMEKLAEGVLQLDTAIGPRFVQLNLKQRLYLLWMFRNFPSLPHQVLSAREQRLIDRVVEENGYASMSGIGSADSPVIGRIERRPAVSMEILPLRKPVAASNPAVREQTSEAASA